jgi:biofilm PGA synthesis N-glycosyltransferase PgaC
MSIAIEAVLAFVALYPVVTAAMWISGGLIFRIWEERRVEQDRAEWPGVTVLIPAYNEEAVIATGVQAALASEYPRLEVLVLDDGSTDATEAAARAAAAGDERCRVIRDPVNRGKAERLNAGFDLATHEYVVITDADGHLHPRAIRYLVERIESSPLLAAVAGGPHVTNRDSFLAAMQVLEAAAIIGLIRRTQSLTGRVGTVAGVLAIFRRERVLAVGGFDGRMATEDIDLTWRLLMAGWHTAYEPRALVGMEVPSSLSALWAQRKRWARGQGEVLHAHFREVFRWRNHRMWLVALESLASLLWVIALVAALVLAVLNLLLDNKFGFFGLGLAWGVAISVVATIQLIVAMGLRFQYDRWALRALVVAVVYPLAFWLVSASAALRRQIPALIRGPRERQVVWDIPREQVAGDEGSAR